MITRAAILEGDRVAVQGARKEGGGRGGLKKEVEGKGESVS